MITEIQQEFRRRVSERVALEPEGSGRYRVFTPFRFDDGDHFGIVLKQSGNRWFFTDEGSTFMHLSYWLDEQEMESGTRNVIIQNALSEFSVAEQDGELTLEIPDEEYSGPQISDHALS